MKRWFSRRFHSIKQSTSQEFVIVLILLGVSAWCAHYWKFQSYGLYEDDFHFAFDGWYRYGWDFITQYLYEWPEGRPLGWITLLTLLNISGFFGKLPAAYLLGYLIFLSNSILFYYLMKRLCASHALAFLGALGFILFPADTTQMFLTHSLKLQISLTYTLIAFQLFLLEKKTPAYIFAFLILINYETPFAITFLFPFFRSKLRWKEIWNHILILIMIMLVYFLIRYFFMMDLRTDELVSDFSKPVENIIFSLFNGPFISLLSFIRGPIFAVRHWKPILFWVFAAAVGSFLGLSFIFQSKFTFSGKRDVRVDIHHALLKASGRILIPREVLDVLLILLRALLMLVFAYFFSFTRPALAVAGKVTSSHLGATIPASIIFASLVWLILYYAKRFQVYWIGMLLFSIWMGGLFSYRWLIMEDYQKSWLYQRWYYTQVFDLSPDLSEADWLIVMPVDAYQETFIYTYPIYSEAVFYRMLAYYVPIHIIFLDNPVIKQFLDIDGQVVYQSLDEARFLNDEDRLVVIYYEDGWMKREAEFVMLAGQVFDVVPPPADPERHYELSDFGEWLYAPYLSGAPIPSQLLE